MKININTIKDYINRSNFCNCKRLISMEIRIDR